MGHYSHIQEQIEYAKQAIEHAEEQLTEAKKQQGTDIEQYTLAQQKLEQADIELEQLIRSAPPEQKDQLQRAQYLVRQTQNEMILGLP